MDPVTLFVIAALMMLANGGVLGVMHRDIPVAIQPAARSWRISTLLAAGGCLMYAVQRQLPPAFVLPLANGLVMLGFTGYWHALRQFYGYPVTAIVLWPAALGTFGVFWFAAITPDTGIRILIVSVVWIFIMSASVRILLAQSHRDNAMSRRVLAVLFIGLIAFTLFRVIYFVTAGINPDFSVVDTGNWMNGITPMLVAILPVIGTTAFLLMCSERIRRQWERAASTDYLTGLANRRTLTTAGNERFAAARSKEKCLALAVIDIDHFKSINDRYGHDIGDVALKHVAAHIEAACRDRELPARLGGEEFVVLFDDVDAARAGIAGERIRQAVESEPFVAGDLRIPLTVSIGVAVQHAADTDFDSLLRRADLALYAAKNAGRNRVEVAG